MPISSPALSQARDMQGLNTCRANRRRYLSQRKVNPARPRDHRLEWATCLATATPVLRNRLSRWPGDRPHGDRPQAGEPQQTAQRLAPTLTEALRENGTDAL